MTQEKYMEATERSGALFVRIHRPPLNILDIPTIQEINQALDAAARRPEIRFVVFSGSGTKAFSAGVDVKDHTPDRVGEMLGNFHRIFRTLHSGDKISIARVQGHCLGGGCELALFCDFVIASEDARFGQPEIKLGCFPPVAAIILPALIGYRRALELLLGGETISAQQALALGLVNRVVPTSELDAAVDECMAKLAAHSGAVLALTKRAVFRAMGLDFNRALDEVEELYLKRLMQTADAQEGIRAFIEKRAPVWQGR